MFGDLLMAAAQNGTALGFFVEGVWLRVDPQRLGRCYRPQEPLSQKGRRYHQITLWEPSLWLCTHSHGKMTVEIVSVPVQKWW